MKAWLIFLCLTTAVLSSFSEEVADGTSSPPHAETEGVAPTAEESWFAWRFLMKLLNFQTHQSQETNETEDDPGEKPRQEGKQKEERNEEEDAPFWHAIADTIGDDKKGTMDTTSDQAKVSETYSPEGLNAMEPSPELQTTTGSTTAPTSAVTTEDGPCLSRQCQARRNPWAECTGSTPEDEATLSQSLSEFTVEFYKAAIRQAKAHSNLVFSPLSVSVMMSNLLLGACNETKDRLEKLLFYPQEFPCVHSALGSLSKSKSLNSANAVFFPPQLTLNSVFENLTKTFYQTKLRHLTNNTSQDVIDINVWVSQATNHKIKKLLDTLDPGVQMVLLNAVYFQSKWKTFFRQKNTKDEDFYREDLPPIKVPMMTNRKYPVASYVDYHLQAKVARLQMENNMHMVIILPHRLSQSLSEIERRLSAPVIMSMLDRLKNTAVKPTVITLPKFKVESSQDLMEIVGEMDYGIFFETDLCRVSENEEMMVSSAQHKAMLEINEEGVTAAAATSVSLARVANVLEVQQPFIFLVVYDNGITAFMGRVHNPQTP